MRICLLEPYATGSHAAWAHGYAAHSRHQVDLLTMAGRFWKWRMHGGAVTLARCYREQDIDADLLLATDMLDLPTFLALTRDRTHGLPVALYMHENQLTYPWPPEQRPDLHYAFINYASMLSADSILFNSHYHLESWFEALPRLLRHFPDYNELSTVRHLRSKSEVLPLGLDLAALDAHRPSEPRTGPALIVWNHRWEYDKAPEAFLDALYSLAARDVPFCVALLGEAFERPPKVLEEAVDRLRDRVVHVGYAKDRGGYARWLWRGDIVASTALHDFFGAAVVEAMYCDCLPILPDRLTYPQFIPSSHRERCLYSDQDGLVALLERATTDVAVTRAVSLRCAVARYDWSIQAPEYDRRFAHLAQQQADA
jgi:glycosyltransferase involved in cell wall biosynthesis